MDVKSVFLYGILKEELYVKQLAGNEIEGKQDKFKTGTQGVV